MLARSIAGALGLVALGLGVTLPPAAMSMPRGDTPSRVGPLTTVSAPPAAGSAQQVIAVSISPGPLTVTPSVQHVPLARQGEHLIARIANARVVDARGSLVGWSVDVHVIALVTRDGHEVALDGSDVDVRPSKPVVVYGNPRDEVTRGRDATLAVAAAGGGGGTYEVGGELRVKQARRARDFVAARVELITH